MKPVVCFFENDQYFYSENYLRLEVPLSSLAQIQIEYFHQTKILQTDFEGTWATVFVLHDFQIVEASELMSSKPFAFEFLPNINKEDFIQKVQAIKKDIEMGRYYQVNLTSSFSSKLARNVSALEIFKYFFKQFQPRYGAFLPLSQNEILCFSPEMFLEKTGQKIRTCPIKGTTSKEQKFSHLLHDEKENAELSMIVDLLRNDLQSVCEPKVIVTQHRQRLSLNYVTHTFSEITGATKLQLPEILPRLLPAGSISGCPKKESILAIHELENYCRGFYTGCIGWWKENDFKLNVAIRSFLRDENKITYFSGCGIVFDSDPEKEWQEFHHKAKHLQVQP